MYKHTFYYFLCTKKYPEIYILLLYDLYDQSMRCSQIPTLTHQKSVKSKTKSLSPNSDKERGCFWEVSKSFLPPRLRPVTCQITQEHGAEAQWRGPGLSLCHPPHVSSVSQIFCPPPPPPICISLKTWLVIKQILGESKLIAFV